MTPSIDLKESARKCLVALGKTPKALLYLDGETDYTYDLPDLFGIPVFHAVDLGCYYWGREPINCPFVPLGATDGEITSVDRRRFAQAWQEPVSKTP
jgi:hypothetical protein